MTLRAKVILFKASGKYYTEEEWEVPSIDDLPFRGDYYAPQTCMKHSKDFRTIGGGPVLIEAQEPWGYPGMIIGRRV